MSIPGIPPHLAEKMMETMIQSGALSVLQVDGTSMEPFIMNGQKVIVDHRIREFDEGDVILFEREGHDGTFLHRVVARDGENLVTKGDSRFSPDPPVCPGQVKGVVTALEAPGGGRVFIDREPWKTACRVMAALSRRQWLLHSQVMQEGTGDAKRAEELHQEGYAHYREGRRAEALESFRQALAHDPRRVLTRVDVGEILRQQGRGDEALVHLRMAIEMEGEPTRLSAQAYNIAGNVLSERGSFLESLEEYDSSIRIDPIFAPAYVNRGWALYKLERMEEAEADFRKVLELEAGNFKALKCLGLLCLSNGRPGEAREILDLAACIQPGDPDVLNNLGLALLKSGRLQAAGESFQKALNMEPGHFDTLFNVGRFLEKSGRSEEARLHFGSLLEAFPQWKDLLMMEMARLIGKERKGNDDHA